ncbi:glycosyl hydrolase family 65 protein [Sinomonas sp. ASV322]|uniref:glycoside hydrolase family 65 protein n=1 Tax=Sinomonas sp. ASV322 TaxID=3041920 RepID=UPI0027DB8FF8|nr:glycosyl hydrolase family 65 protein [Sinomonas sp. ASV322]MDQ4502847.1 glycosyl hydrolase family 65 protein [Sinomonas sp. ASV322]
MTLVSADRTRFPVDPWALVETSHAPGSEGALETLFSLGNGHLGVRGAHLAEADAGLPGTFVNGFHEIFDIRHAENAYGFAKQGQRILYVPDAQESVVRVDGEHLTLAGSEVLEYRRRLDFATGVYECTVVWKAVSGAIVTTTERRVVGAASRSSLGIELVISADRRIVADVESYVVNRQDQPRDDHSEHDPRRAGRHAGRVLEPIAAEGSNGSLRLEWATVASRQHIAVAVDHSANSPMPPFSTEPGSDRSGVRYVLPLDPGETFRLEKRVGYAAAQSSSAGLLDAAVSAARGFHELLAESAAHYARYWAAADIQVGASDDLQQAVRWNLFQLAQATSQAGIAGIPAKGVTGSGYEGHYFWDQEVYLLPYLTYTAPAAARKVLEFRHRMLPAATERAAELNVDGALFPWRTINGQEASAYYAAGTAQFHINAAIAFAAARYAWASGDAGFRVGPGADLLVETARMWASLGFFGKNGQFHIHGVTGPDEYTAVVNDNLYTNVMARFNLRAAAALDHPSISDTERLLWSHIAERIAVPYDSDMRVHAQDADFMTLEPWDWETPRSKYPLLLHFHPLVIYRHQVIKQADAVLAMFLQWQDFTAEEKQRAFDFYDPITTGDSTLSACVQGIMAAEVGYLDEAMRHFTHAVFIDLDNLHRNTIDGVHTASAGGVWSALINGFAGFRDQGTLPHFDPRLPQEWESLSFRLQLHGRTLSVRLTSDDIELAVEGGDPLEVSVRGSIVAVGTEPTVVALGPVAVPAPSVFPRPFPTAGLSALAPVN